MPYYGIHLEDNDKILYLSGVETEKSTIPFDFITSGEYVWSSEGDITGSIIETEMHPTSLYRLFYNCANMSFIRGLEKIDTSNVTTMEDTFLMCKSLKTLYLKMWDTSNVTTMDSMFQLCTSLKNINIDGWNTDKVSTFSLMFYNCTSLETIYCSQTWKGTSPSSGMMFERCLALGWGALGSNLSYANPTENGYFTIPSKAAYFAPENNNDQEVVSTVSSVYLGNKNGIAAKVKKVYFGDANGVARLCWAGFPAEPTEYLLINTYTSSQTWVAPGDGWYKVEVYGASGRGGYALFDAGEEDVGGEEPESISGGGGGSGGYASSTIKLRAGDTIKMTTGAVGVNTTVTVDSSNSDSYDHTITITCGKNGGSGTHNMVSDPGDGGAGGIASGGLDVNINGNSGRNGTNPDGLNAEGGAGGAAVVTGGNAGGVGASVSSAKPGSPGPAKASFVKIYRGNTN